MADQKLTQLTENSTPAGTDILYVVDDPGGSPLSQKITVTNLLSLAPSANLVQSITAVQNTASSTATAMPFDDTIPQITEGAEVVTVAITPTNASNRLRIIATFSGATNTALTTMIAIFQDATANALVAAMNSSTADGFISFMIEHEMAAGTTSSTTFRLRAGNNSGATTYWNSNSTGRKFGGVMGCRITVQEIAV